MIMKNNWLSILASLALILVWTSCSDDSLDSEALSDDAAARAKQGKFDVPMLSFSSTENTITVTVTAGSTGAPAGFSLQWMRAEDFATYGWHEEAMCKGSYSGNANSSRYRLSGGQSVDIVVGDMLFDNGASLTCEVPLECETDYVFRVFAHATSNMFRSDFSAAYEVSTADCSTCNQFGFGHWKDGNNWPEEVEELEIGNNTYSKADLLDVLNSPNDPGNALKRMSKQLIATLLNEANGVVLPSDIQDAVDEANSLIGDNDIRVASVASNTTLGQAMNVVKDVLEAFNNACETEEDEG
jgi:ribosomal protein L7Ae-like RNA K-turn-binding protein